MSSIGIVMKPAGIPRAHAWSETVSSAVSSSCSIRIEILTSIVKKSGEFLGLTSAERRRLRRDGDQHAAEIQYRFNFAEKHWLAPAFVYSYDDREGGAMKNDAYNFQLTYLYFGDPITLTANAFFGKADYDDRNPIYGKTQDDDNYGLQGSLFYKNPWGWSLFGSKPMNFFIATAFAKSDSNIDFYDQEAFMASVGVFFKW